MNINASRLNPYAFNLAIKTSRWRQSNALDSSVNKEPCMLPLSTVCFQFLSLLTNIVNFFKAFLGSNTDILKKEIFKKARHEHKHGSKNTFQKILINFSNMLIGLYFSFKSC